MYFLFRYSSFLSNSYGHMLVISQDRAQVTFWYRKWGLNFYISQAISYRRSGKGMEDLRLKLEDLKRWWEDDHRQLVRLAAAGDRTHVVQRERELRRFSGSALDLQYAATEKQVRVSAQDAVTEGMAKELSLKELIHGAVASQKVLTENVALQQATIRRLSKQQGELLQAMALTPMRHEHCNGNNRPLNDECYYCHRRGHFKRNCAALKRAQRNNAELASIARRHRGKRRDDAVVDSACLKQRQSSRESSS